MNWSLKNQTNTDLKEIAEQHNIVGHAMSYGELFRNTEPALVQAILKDPEHPMRHGLNIAAMFEIHYAVADFGDNGRSYFDEEEEDIARNKAVRARFNRWISKLGGFTVTTREEK